jgi:hypothetical protein
MLHTWENDSLFYQLEVRVRRIVCIESANQCRPLSKIDLAHYIWSTFDYGANYAMIVQPKIPQAINCIRTLLRS